MRGAIALLLVGASTALAQPKAGDKVDPNAASGDKTDAKALMASGLKLFQAKDYLGALAVFKSAYARFPSSKILLNIATTLKQLNRYADAANTYQRYVDASDADAAKKPDVEKAIADLDAKVGIVDLLVKPADAEIQFVGDDEWHPAAEVAHYRVSPGAHTIRARKDAFTPAELSLEVAAGKRAPLSIELAPVPVTATTQKTVATASPGGEVDGGEVAPGATPAASSRFGAYALAHVDVTNRGAAARVGVTIELLPRLQAEIGGILGPSSGGYAGARYAILPGMLRPVLAVGAPIFIKDGAHVALRGSVGLDVIVTPHLSLVAEIGVERVLNPGMNYVETMFVPALGAAGRL